MVALMALALAAPPPGAAQERDRERERREAERRLEEAQRELAEAIRKLREQDQDARRNLERAMRELRAAERELSTDVARGRLRELMVLPESGRRAFVSVFADERPRIGVILETEDHPAVDSIGARLQAVTPGGPADEAGLRAGDVVTRANGQVLARTGRGGERPGERLARIVRELEEGDTLRLEYRRDGETRTATVVPRRLGPQAYELAWSGDSADAWVEALPRIAEGRLLEPFEMGGLRIRLPLHWLDLELVTLDEGLGRYFGTREGLLVVRAPRDTSLGLQSGDVILTIDGREPASPSHALRIMRSYEPGETMRIEIMRDRRRMTVTATAPERE
jgi:C-terminal processing protease CtpA/Prc